VSDELLMQRPPRVGSTLTGSGRCRVYGLAIPARSASPTSARWPELGRDRGGARWDTGRFPAPRERWGRR
jgi:hypothetical protein